MWGLVAFAIVLVLSCYNVCSSCAWLRNRNENSRKQEGSCPGVGLMRFVTLNKQCLFSLYRKYVFVHLMAIIFIPDSVKPL